MLISKNIVCYCSELEKFYFSPTFSLDFDSSDFLNIYVFIGISPDTEIGEASVTSTIPSPLYVKKTLKNIIYLKKINVNNISPVAERIDWKQNTFYDSYDHKKDMSERDSEGKLINKFYVKNKYDQVFKCLWNNVNSSNAFSISSVENNETYYTINHEGGTFEVGSYITILKSDPIEYNGTYKVISSSFGTANVSYGTSGSYIITTTKDYVANATIKQTALSTTEPYFDVGTFDKEFIVTTPEGYKWKYIYTLNKSSKLKFYDSSWMPVPVQANYKTPDYTVSGWGSIDTINVINGGSGYENGTNTVNVIISGDGNYASAQAYVANNTIQDIIMVNKGTNYITANVSIVPVSGFGGSGAEVDVSISPIGGHGLNFIRDLYCRNVMINGSFDDSEEGRLPTDIIYNQVGVLYNPYKYDNIYEIANSSYIDCMTDILLSPEEESFDYGEIIYQGTSLEESTFNARVVSYDSGNSVIKVVNTNGTIKENFEILGNDSGSRRVVKQINTPLFVPNSGNLFYLENKPEINRSALSSEQIRILIKYS